MDENLKLEWHFPNNNYTSERGLDNSDMEMFKQDPISSLAREICQNSIDAPYNDKPVKVEFNAFSIPREEVPGVDELATQIHACYEYKKDSPKEEPALKILIDSIDKPIISCLRISDFNTTGLIGVASNEPGKPFYNLTKGSGISDKGGSSGGSKGIGKYASFVVSTTNTVFYSTKASDNSCGYIGISQLRSAPIPGEDPDLLTMGIGYYGRDNKNNPILEELHLDKNFSRADHEYGTDIYIIGFNNQKGWQSDIIAKVLESFMVAIIRNKLVVSVDGIEVNRDSVESIIYNDKFQARCKKLELREILSQYELLKNDDTVSMEELQIDGNNAVSIYVKRYNQQNEDQATKHCIMVRDPYMKIKHITIGVKVPFSALCIIHQNELNERLRAIENPKHIDWEIKRLDNFPEEKAITKKLKKELEDTIKEYIKTVLHESEGERTDIEGAGEFLPSPINDGESNAPLKQNDQMRISPMTTVRPSNPKTQKIDDNGEAYDFDKGDLTDDGEPGKKPTGGSSHPNPYPHNDPNDETEVSQGKSSVLKKKPLRGMQYRTIVTDKNNGAYDCIFTSKYDEDNCELSVQLCGDSADKYPITILAASMDGKACNVQDGKIIGLKIAKDKTYKISYSVDNKELFASEVILNAYR